MSLSLSEALGLKKPAQKCTPKALARIHRQDDFIKTLLDPKVKATFEEICDMHNIARRTGYEWFDQWKQREGFRVDVTWWQLVEEVRKKNPAKALEALTRLKYRMTPTQIDKTIDITKRELKIVRMWQPDAADSASNP